MKILTKNQSRHRTRSAIKKGLLTRQPCSVCGNLKAEAHHEDYQKPLDVKWLCKTHHTSIHFPPIQPLQLKQMRDAFNLVISAEYYSAPPKRDKKAGDILHRVFMRSFNERLNAILGKSDF